MTPYYEHAGITIYHGDCREVLPLIPKCDLVVADPPYNCGKDYGIYKDNLSELEYAVMWREIVNLCLSKAVNQFWVAPRYKLKLWLELLPGAHLVVITRSAQGPSRAGGASGDQFEIALACGRPKNQIADLWTDIRLKGEGFYFREETFGHPGYTPLPIMRRAIHFLSVDSIIDPCCGTGTSLYAAKKLGRKAFGCELNEEYCEIAAKRLSQELLDLQPEFATLP